MIIRFSLAWLKTGNSLKQTFKTPGTFDLFLDYYARIKHFSPCEISGSLKPSSKTTGKILWLCHTSPRSKEISTEKLAQHLNDYLNSGIKEWTLAIGGPNGFSEADVSELRPDFCWRFGPLTLPHELAAVVAGEQVYRAWSILKGLPYHKAH